MFAMRRLIYTFYDELKFLLCMKLLCFPENPNTFFLILVKENRNHWQAVWTLDYSKIHTVRQEKLAKRGATKLQLSIWSISSIRGTPAERLGTHCRPKHWPQSSHKAVKQRSANATSGGTPHPAYPQSQPSGVAGLKLISPLQGHPSSPQPQTGWDHCLSVLLAHLGLCVLLEQIWR